MTCPYCNLHMRERTSRAQHGRFPTRDHIVPKSRGGDNHPDNVLIVCHICNGDKGDMMLGEFLGWLTARDDPRAAIISGLLKIAANGEPELIEQLEIDAAAGRARAAREAARVVRRELRDKIGLELVH